jgi:ribosomal-protein-alanine N-acetyltransferase
VHAFTTVDRTTVNPKRMNVLSTPRLQLRPFGRPDFDVFVDEMLTDPMVVEFYHFYRQEADLAAIRAKAEDDFWQHFETSRAQSGYEVFAILDRTDESMVGWAGLLETSLSAQYDGPELQYMLRSEVHGRGYATEAAIEVVRSARETNSCRTIIATVDIPNIGSIRVLEKLGFELDGEIDAYGSSEMFLYTNKPE